MPNGTGDVRLIFCRLTINDLIGRFPSNVGVHRRANQRAPLRNTIACSGGSGTSVQREREREREMNTASVTWLSSSEQQVLYRDLLSSETLPVC